MFYREIFKTLGTFYSGFSLTLLAPLLICCYYEHIADSHPQPRATLAFLQTFSICLLFGISLRWLGRGAKNHLYLREGLLTVVALWFITPMISALPFYLSGTLDNPYQAYFEAVSGLTTTGATVMDAKKYTESGDEVKKSYTFSNVVDTTYHYYGTILPALDSKTGKTLYTGVEAVGKGILFWRSFTQWLGGLGIVVLFVAVLPALGVEGKILLFTEMPGPLKDSLTPRIKETAAVLWKIYVGLTGAQMFFLHLTNRQIGWYDCLTISFSTLSTGGFSTKNGGIASFNSLYTEWVVIFFMIVGSLNFSLYFQALRGKFYRIYESELFLFFATVFCSAAFCAYELHGRQNISFDGTKEIFSWGAAIRHATFQTISFQSSTGFASTDYDKWPYVTQVLLVILMFVGGMSGSTSGGMKMTRFYMIFHIVHSRVESLFRPNAVQIFRFKNREIGTGIALTVLCYFTIVAFFTILGTFILTWDGIDPETACATIACMINNVGLGFRMAGPSESFAFLSNFALVVSSIWMILGRLEFYALLVLLLPSFWRR